MARPLFRGDRLLAARQAAGISREDLASALELSSPRRIRVWESGHERPRPRFVPRLAAALGVEPLYLLDVDPDDPPLAALRAAAGRGFAWPLAVVCAVFLLGVWKAFFRLRAVALVLEEYHAELRAGLWAHLTLWPVTAALFLYNALAAAASRRIRWRGIRYELKSPTETVIIRNEEVSSSKFQVSS